MEEERIELHSGLGSNFLDGQNTFMFSCPYLGTLEDTDTALSYPAPDNHCFRTKSPASIELSHQEAYCLTDRHPSCHIFTQKVTTKAVVKPETIAVQPNRPNRRASIYALPLVLILIFLAAILWWPAPGTIFQEAIAFGAQLQGSNDQIPEQPLKPETSVIEAPAAVDTNLASDNQPVSSLAQESNNNSTGGSQVGQDGLVTTIESATDDIQTNADEEQVASAPEQPEEESAPAARSDSTFEGQEAAMAADEPEAAVQTTETADSANMENAAAESANTQEIETIASAAVQDDSAVDTGEAAETDAANTVEDEQNLALIIHDLPVIDSQSPVQFTTFEQPAPAAFNGERAIMIGPDEGAPLALRENNNDIRTLFVRPGPNLESGLLIVINRRQQAALLGRDTSGAWFKLRLQNGVEGWVNATESRTGIDPRTLPVVDGSSRVVTSAPPISTVTALPVLRSARVNTGALNLRSGPSVTYEPITILNQGEIVGLIGRRGAGVWVRVRLDNGLEGWVNSSLLAPLT